MGEIADMMMDGILCEACGVLIDGHEVGFPRLCEDCDAPPSEYVMCKVLKPLGYHDAHDPGERIAVHSSDLKILVENGHVVPLDEEKDESLEGHYEDTEHCR